MKFCVQDCFKVVYQIRYGAVFKNTLVTEYLQYLTISPIKSVYMAILSLILVYQRSLGVLMLMQPWKHDSWEKMHYTANMQL